MSWIFIFITLLAISGVWIAYGEARQKRTIVAWILFLMALASFILNPIDRVKSDAEAAKERKSLEEKISLQDELISKQSKSLNIVLQKNEALEKQVVLLNLIKKQVTKFGIRIEASFRLPGSYIEKSYRLIPMSNPPYAKLTNRSGPFPEVLFQSQTMHYYLLNHGVNNGWNSFDFKTTGEILNAQFPVAESVNALKGYDLITFYIPFFLSESSTPDRGSNGQLVHIDSIKAEFILNGVKIKKTIQASNLPSLVGVGYFYDQTYWITIPLVLKKDIFNTLELSKF